MIKKIVLVTAAIFILSSAYSPQAAKPEAVLIGAVVAYPWSAQMITVPGRVGEVGMAKVFFKPSEGFKWNRGYPASFVITTKKFTIADPIKEEIYFKDGTLCVPYMAKESGRIQVQGLMNFSICNKRECLVFRNEKITLSLIAVSKN